MSEGLSQDLFQRLLKAKEQLRKRRENITTEA